MTSARWRHFFLSLSIGLLLGSSPSFGKQQSNRCALGSVLKADIRKAFCEIAVGLAEPTKLMSGRRGSVFRLIADPSFSHPFTVRIIGRDDGRRSITLRAFDSRARPIARTAILSKEEYNQIRSEITSSGYWDFPTIADASFNPADIEASRERGLVVVCGDGTEWVMDAISSGRYHISYAACGAYPRFEKLAVAVAKLAQTKFPSAAIDWSE